MYDLLKGVRVLDLTSVVLGPFATRYLGDFGADVIKVEPPAGDIFRSAGASKSPHMGAGFLNLNRNKRSIALDLKTEKDRSRLQALLQDADVLVHNMRPAAAERLGLDPAAIQKRYPRLVYCVSTGYGSRGRNADLPAYDDIIQAASGLASLNRTESGAPRFLPSVICDKIGGLHLALAVLAGVVQQSKTGQGCFMEAPMFEGLVSFLLAEHLDGETFRPAQGNMGYGRIMSPHRKPFATQDGFIGVLPYNEKHWVSFLSIVGRADLANAEWIKDPQRRSARIGELYAVIEGIMPSRTTSEWLTILKERDIPCTAVNTLDSLLNDPHLADVGFFQDVYHPTEGALRSIRSPFWMNGKSATDSPPPQMPTANQEIFWKNNCS